jgi:hypothetical protein
MRDNYMVTELYDRNCHIFTNYAQKIRPSPPPPFTVTVDLTHVTDICGTLQTICMVRVQNLFDTFVG